MPLTSVVKSMFSHVLILTFLKQVLPFSALMHIWGICLKWRSALPFPGVCKCKKTYRIILSSSSSCHQKDECNSLIGGCGHLSEAWRDVSDSNRTVLHTIPYKYTSTQYTCIITCGIRLVLKIILAFTSLPIFSKFGSSVNIPKIYCQFVLQFQICGSKIH